jgi:two-component system nitrate/nitrite response regulator NarL
MAHRVAIVGAVRLFREGLATLLGVGDTVDIVAQQSCDDDGILHLSGLNVDVILVFVMSQADCARLQAIRDAGGGARLVAVGVPQHDDLIIACAEAGVSGYVPAESTIDDVVRVIDGVVLDQPPIPPSIAAILLRYVATRANQLTGDEVESRLTRREAEVVRCLRQNLTNKQIAHELHIDVSTVKNHIHSILVKLGVEGRMAAAAANKI